MINKVVNQLKLPSLPNTVRECLSQLYNSEADMDKLAATLQKDLGLVVSVLKLANSVLYASGKLTSDLKTGMTRIGLTSVMQILVTQFMENVFRFDPIEFFNIKAFTKHCVWVSQVAFELGKATNLPNSTDIVIAGLMHDVGFLARVLLDRNLMVKITEKTLNDKIEYCVAEKSLKVEGHDTLGCELLTQWQLPEEVILLVKYHHTSESFRPRNLSSEQNKSISILAIADTIAHRFGNAYVNYPRDTRVNPTELEKLGLTNNAVADAVKLTTAQLQNY